MPTQTIFESEQELLIFKNLSGNSPESLATTFGHWLRKHSPQLLSAEERLKIARTFTRVPFPAEQWLPTIEFLRSALVLNREQAVFCFNQIPKTAKNKSLRDCFFFYLESPLVEDPMGQLWNWVSEFKSHTPPPPFFEKTTFVPSSVSTYLFREFCHAFQHLPQEAQVSARTFQELLGNTPPPQEGPLRQGPRLKTLEALAQAVHQHLTESPHEKVLISFLGTNRSQEFIKLRLASLGNAVADWILNEPRSEKSPHTVLLENVRKNSELSLEEKLTLNSILNSHRPYFSESLSTYLDRLTFQNLIEQKHKDLLGNLTKPIKSTSDEFSRSVSLVPWMILPHLPGVRHFSFCDESFTSTPLNSYLLSENELDTLFFSGFHLPRKSETLKGRLEVLNYTYSHWPSDTYTSLTEEELAPFRCEPVSFSATKAPFVSAPPTAPLPLSRLSATQLETYADCPSKYLFRRLKLKEPVLPLSEFALQLGQSVHKTLETLLQPSSFLELNEDLLRSTFLQSLQETLPPFERAPSRRLFYVKAFEKFIPRILEMESTLKRVFRTQSTLAAEKEFSISLNGIPVIGKIDRVDLLENGQLLVLDYKTGNVDFTPDHLNQGTNFQALLYWLGAQQVFNLPPAAMLFYDLKKGEVKRGLAKEESLSSEAKKSLTRGHALKNEKLDSLISSGLEQLDALAKSIRAGDFTPKPSAEACRFCEAPAFCREGQGYA